MKNVVFFLYLWMLPGLMSAQEKSKVFDISLSAGLNSLIMTNVSGGLSFSTVKNQLAGFKINSGKELALFGESEERNTSLDVLYGWNFAYKYGRIQMFTGLSFGSDTYIEETTVLNSGGWVPLPVDVSNKMATKDYIGIPLELNLQLAGKSIGYGLQLRGNINSSRSYFSLGAIVSFGTLK